VNEVGVSVDSGNVTLSNVTIVDATTITATVTPDAGDPTEKACVMVTQPPEILVVRAPRNAKAERWIYRPEIRISHLERAGRRDLQLAKGKRRIYASYVGFFDAWCC
jgi:hypothetical protein